jgi:hypothetical protein
MTSHDPDERSGWSLLGFLRSVLRRGSDFRRLCTLLLLVSFVVLAGYALAKGDALAFYRYYDHLTAHDPAWEKWWGIPPGGVATFFGAWKFFAGRRARRLKREMQAREALKQLQKAKKGKKGNGKKGKKRKDGKKLARNGPTAKARPKKARD